MRLFKIKEDAQPRSFDTLPWSFFLATLSVVAGITITILLKLLSLILIIFLEVDIIDFWTAAMLGTLASIGIILSSEKDGVIIPETKLAAQLLWLGSPIPWYLYTGKYPWLGTALGFSRSKRVSDSFTDAAGFLKMGRIPFRVWDDASAAAGSPERSYVSAPAKNDATIKSALTLIFTIKEPWKVLAADQPALELGDKARQEFREFVSLFVDTDVPKLHSVMSDVFQGKIIVTSVIGEAVPGFKKGSMIVDRRCGEVMYEIVAKKGDEAEQQKAIEEASKKLVERLLVDGNPKMVAKVKKEEYIDGVNDSALVKPIQVKNPIQDVLTKIGCNLEEVIFADIEFAKEVQDAANQAAAEQNQRISQLESADTISAARKKLLPSKEEADLPGFELATVIAAAQDDKSGNIKVIMVPGGSNDSSLLKAAIAGASEIKNGSK